MADSICDRLSPEIITMISSYFDEEDRESACIALKAFFICATSVVYHVNYLNMPRKRKNKTNNAIKFSVYREKVWQLLQNPANAGRLRGITVLKPYDFDESHVDRFRLNARKHFDTALVEREAEVSKLFELLSRHAPYLRFLETTICQPLIGLDLPALIELRIPSTTSLQGIDLPCLKRLTLLHNHRTADNLKYLPPLPGLTHLHFHMKYFLGSDPLPQFIDLDGYPKLHELHLSASRVLKYEDNYFADPRIFRGHSSSLYRLVVEGAFYFNNYKSMGDWLIQLSAKTIVSISFCGMSFPLTLDPNTSLWPAMPSLRSFELHGLSEPFYFRTFPCGSLRQLYVSCVFKVNDDALTAMLQRAKESLEVLSVVRRPIVGRGFLSRGSDLQMSDTAVSALAECRKLKHLELIGIYWRLSSSLKMHNVVFPRLDQFHLNICGTPFLLKPMPPSLPLLEIYKGKFWTSKESYWVDETPPDWVVQAKPDTFAAIFVAQFLSQQFRMHADIERDLQITRNLSGWEEGATSNLVPSPRVVKDMPIVGPTYSTSIWRHLFE